MKERDRSVRPSVLALAALIVAACVFAIYEATHFEPLGPEASAEVARSSRSSRRPGRNRRSAGAHHGASHGAGGDGAYVHHDWGQESELSRQMALDLPGESFWRDVAQRGAAVQDDPQLFAMWRSFHGMAGPEGEAPDLPFEPTGHRAELVDSEGDVNASPSSCDVRVLPVSSGSFNCVVRVMCDGEVLYPNPSQTAGYVGCELGDDGRPIRAVDSGFSSRDGDPLVSLDLENGTVTVEDFDESGERRYRATLRING